MHGDLETSVVAHAFNFRNQEREAGRPMGLRPMWSTEQVPGKPGLHRETLSQQKEDNEHKSLENSVVKFMH